MYFRLINIYEILRLSYFPSSLEPNAEKENSSFNVQTSGILLKYRFLADLVRKTSMEACNILQLRQWITRR